MEEEKKNVDPEEITEDELKEAIEERMSKLRRQSMLLGLQVACQSILDKIVAFERKPGSKSNNDHKRLIKDIKQFAEQGLSRKSCSLSHKQRIFLLPRSNLHQIERR